MKDGPYRIAHRLRRRFQHRLSSMFALMGSLVFLLILVPIVEQYPGATVVLRFGLTAVLVSAVIASGVRRRPLTLGLVFSALVAAPLSWATLFIEHGWMFAASCVIDSLIFVVMAVVILVSVFRRHIASVHSIFGAIGAYLLLGLAWAVLYWGVDHLDGTALHANAPKLVTSSGTEQGEVTALSQFIYFSFVTMSTLGYGDIVPRTPLVQTLTWMQSVTGQFYNAVLVAWLVGVLPRQSRRGRS